MTEEMTEERIQILAKRLAREFPITWDEAYAIVNMALINGVSDAAIEQVLQQCSASDQPGMRAYQLIADMMQPPE